MKKFILLALTVFSVYGAWSQRSCGTVQHEQMLMQSDPHYAARRQAIDQFAQNYQYNPGSGQRSVITIPVVVHVVYSNAAGNISQAQVQSEIDRLNLDYHKSNADTANVPAVWKSLVADCNIQFCLAQRDPNGAATTGIVRKSTTVTSWSTNDAVKYTAQGGDDAWPASSYLNIWVCDLGGGLLGYAQFPGGAAATDGVVIINTGFGSVGTAAAPYNLGRTATHEIGHWLNLIHIWGDDNGACTGTDQVADTPNQGNSNYGCPTFPLTDNCTTTSPGTMFMNYMDYVDDACMYMFTNGQNVRIQANFASGGARAAILNSQGCVPVSGGPVTAFTANKTTICVGQSINFTDQTTGNPTSWSWSFPGAATTTSTTQNPQNIVYNTAGVYNVTLTATNTGGSTPLTKTNYITVLGTTPLPLKEGFEGVTFPPTGWTIVNGDGATTWVRTTSASGFGTSTACAYVDNYNYTTLGQKDYLYTPSYSFAHGLNASSKLKFDYAYSLYNATSADSLEILVSTNCGATWTSLWKKGGASLATTSTNYTTVFVPTATEWKRDSTISLASYVGQSSVQFAFVNTNEYGNSLLLDNVNIDTVINSTSCTTHPTAAFVASPTTVTVGSTVTYTDQSTNSPTAWAWTFGGGTPATSAVQAPGAVTYSTVGTYTTKLRVSNACGRDSTTQTITVIPAAVGSGCDTLSHLVAGDSLRLYLADTSAGAGFLSGTNLYGDLAKAEKYSNTNGKPITSLIMGFVYAVSAGPTDSVTVNIWDANGTNGYPGTVLGTTKVSMNTVSTNVNGTTFHYTVATFPTPVTTNATFYAGFDISNIAGDTIAVGTTSLFNGANHQSLSYELNAPSPGTWGVIDSDWRVSLSYFIFPIQCSQSAPVAAFTANVTSVCAGGAVNFTDQSTNSPTSWSWQFNGPVNLVSSAQNPSITFTTPGTYTVILTASNGSGNGSHTQTSYIVVHAAPTDAMSSTSVSCYGGTDGTATVAATGGTSYTYLWSPGGGTGATISGKPAGTYNITVTSNYGCSSTASVVISQPFSALAASLTNSSAYCSNSNGSATVTASGGNGGYTYLWSPGGATSASLSNIGSGTYTVTVKDSKNCSVTGSTVVTNQTATVLISFSNTLASCGSSNGSIVAQINGSSNGAHYHWSRGDTTGSITSVAAGIYTITVTNALGCSAVKSDTLRSTAGPTVSISSTTPVSCFGGNDGSATALGAGGTGSLSYAWNPGGGAAATISGKPSGTYTVTVTDASSCTATATATITQPSAAVTLSSTSTPAICTTPGTATVTPAGGNTGGYTYHWSNTQTTATATNLAAAIYTVTVKDSKQCSATASVTVADQSPTLTVTITNTPATCGNSTGSATANTAATGVTYTWSPGGSHATSLSNIAAGTYSVTITNSNGCSASATTNVPNSNGANVSTSTVPVSCHGGANGSATVTATGGSGTYTYSWSGGGTTNTISNKIAGTYTVTVNDGSSCTVTASVTIAQPAALTATTSTTPVICTTAGTATVTAAGGNGGNTYTWLPGGGSTATITGLAANTYSVTVTDSKQCTAAATAIVADQSQTLTVTATGTNATCGNNNGSATANTTATGITYLWSPGGSTSSSLTGLGAGTYTVTISNSNGCSASASTSVSATSGSSLSVTATNTTCNGGADGTATVTATGGSGNYSYAWSSGATTATATSLAQGVYTVSVTSGACTTTAQATVGQPSAVTVQTSVTPVICTTAGSATAVGGGGSGTGYTYLWNPGGATTPTVTTANATTYTVTVKDSRNCTATAAATVNSQSSTLNDQSTSTPASSATIANGTATATPTGGTPNYTYTWNNGQHTETATHLLPGVYTCTITDANGCTVLATVTVGQGPNGIVDVTPTVHYSVSPNPATDKFTVSIEMNETMPVELSIYSLIGQKVWSKDMGQIKSSSELIDAHDMAVGVYIVKLKAGDQTFTSRLIKE